MMLLHKHIGESVAAQVVIGSVPNTSGTVLLFYRRQTKAANVRLMKCGGAQQRVGGDLVDQTNH